jgi:hypothetical protein
MKLNIHFPDCATLLFLIQKDALSRSILPTSITIAESEETKTVIMSTTVPWDGVKVLGIVNNATRSVTCVGHAPSKNRRCQNSIAVSNSQEAERRLFALPSHSGDSVAIRQQLLQIASLSLCKRNHQDQAREIARQWHRTFVAATQQSAANVNDVPTFQTNGRTSKGASSTKDRSRDAAMNELREEIESLRREKEEIAGKAEEARRSAERRTASSPSGPKSEFPPPSARAEQVQRSSLFTAGKRETLVARAKHQAQEEEARQQAEQQKATEHEEARRLAADQRRKEARRQNLRERAEQEEEKRPEAKRQEQARQRTEQEEQQRRRAERAEQARRRAEAAEEERKQADMKREHASVDSWAAGWAHYEMKWSKLSPDGPTTSHEDVRQTVPWPVKDGSFGSVTCENVKEFFFHVPKKIADSNGGFLQLLRLQLMRWRPDRVVISLPQAKKSAEVVAMMNVVTAVIDEMVMDEMDFVEARKKS